jgi:hypothetical protein
MKLAFYKADKGNWIDTVIDVATYEVDSGYHGYSHVELVFDQVSDGIGFSASPREKKCRFKSIDFDSGHWELVDVPMDETTQLQIFLTAKKYVGKKYDFIGVILWFAFFNIYENHNKYWCSEICMKLLGEKKTRITPNRMAKKFGCPKRKGF